MIHVSGNRKACMAALSVTAVLAAAGVLLVLYLFDPASSVLFPKCPFFLLTGLKCPGCGSQRALHELVHLHIGEALRFNAALVLSVPFLATLAAAFLLRRQFPGFYVKVNSLPVILTVLALLLLWWVFRNLFGL